MTTEQIYSTKHLAKVTQAMRNARERLELEQEEPIDLDQACTIHSFCVMMMIEPGAVLKEETLTLINPGPPLIEALEGEPGLLDELGKVTL